MSKHPLVQALRAEREKQKKSQLELSLDLNMSERNMIHWEQQTRTPNFLSLVDWANALGLEVKLERK